MGAFWPLDFHPSAYFMIWEKDEFSHQFPTVWENATKPIIWGEPFMVYFITWEIHVFSHQFAIIQEKTAKPTEWGKPEKLVPSNIQQNPLYMENIGNWYS